MSCLQCQLESRVAKECLHCTRILLQNLEHLQKILLLEKGPCAGIHLQATKECRPKHIIHTTRHATTPASLCMLCFIQTFLQLCIAGVQLQACEVTGSSRETVSARPLNALSVQNFHVQLYAAGNCLQSDLSGALRPVISKRSVSAACSQVEAKA